MSIGDWESAPLVKRAVIKVCSFVMGSRNTYTLTLTHVSARTFSRVHLLFRVIRVIYYPFHHLGLPPSRTPLTLDLIHPLSAFVRLAHSFSALHHAALTGTTELLSLLLEAQATVDIKDINGNEPTHYKEKKKKKNPILTPKKVCQG